MNGIQQWGGYGGQQLVPQGLLGGLLGASMGKQCHITCCIQFRIKQQSK
jgi:hypothetical protein